jgi:predicted nucleic acid-binding protein
MKRLRIYADTSVFGGCLDEEFSEESRKFFDEVRAGRFVLVLSETTFFELTEAPAEVRDILVDIPSESLEVIEAAEEIAALRDAYIEAGVLGEASIRDAAHVASASVADVDMIVSWNFQQIVHFEKIRGFHAVNLLKGYRMVEIYSPKEVVEP